MASCRAVKKLRYAANIAAGVCVDCSNKASSGQRRCEKCHARNLACARRVKADCRRLGICTRCRKRKVNKGRILCESCLQQHRDEYQRLRDEVFAAYGGYQCQCGENRIDCLQIDHVNNDGAEHRRKIGRGGGAGYRWLKNNGFPEGFQVLCANCNTIKKIYGYVPEYDKDGRPCLPKKHSRSGLCSAVQTKASPPVTSKTASKKRQA